MNNPFPRSFYFQDVQKIARQLLGHLFVKIQSDGSRLSGRIVEVEAYAHNEDPASHSYRGKTLRNAVMFESGGHLYVYFTYGMHYCCNIVTGPEGEGNAILIRALEPLEGKNIMAYKRFGKDTLSAKEYSNLTNGPAKLCKAMGIDREANGLDLCSSTCWIEKGKEISDPQIACSSRVGIHRAVSLPWRYYLKDCKWVSKARIHHE